MINKYLISALGFALTTSSANAQNHPVSVGSLNEKIGKQWVQASPSIEETALTNPETKERMEYKLTAQNENDLLTISAHKTIYHDWYQNFLIVGTAEQTLYRYKAPAAGWTLAGLGITSGGVGLVGLLGAAVAGASSGGSYPCGDVDGDGNEDHCYRDNSDTVGTLALVGLGGLVVVTGSSLLMVKIDPFSHVKTKKHRTVEVQRDTETKRIKSFEDSTLSATLLKLEIDSPYFSVSENKVVYTDIMGNATVQLIPSSENFAFSLDYIGETYAAQQLLEAGFHPEKYIPLLQEAAVPISYDVTIKTKATDGKNAEVTIPVNGYEISQKMLEKVIMGL